MELIISRYGTHAFLQFDSLINNHMILLTDNNGQILHKYFLGNKDFFLLDNIESGKDYIIKIKDNHDEIVAQKKI